MDVLWTLGADIDTGLDGTGINTTEGVETALIRSRNHLGNIQHQRRLGVTVADTDAGSVVGGTIVQSLGTVTLGSDRRRQMDTNHLQQSIRSGQELAHDNLKEHHAFEVPLIRS